MKRSVCISILLLLACLPALSARAAGKLNLLLITVDDMSSDSIGAFGCRLPGTTPSIDRLAKQGMSWE
jgi:N-sulfoglucosamine sulfohydrolase